MTVRELINQLSSMRSWDMRVGVVDGNCKEGKCKPHKIDIDEIRIILEALEAFRDGREQTDPDRAKAIILDGTTRQLDDLLAEIDRELILVINDSLSSRWISQPTKEEGCANV